VYAGVTGNATLGARGAAFVNDESVTEVIGMIEGGLGEALVNVGSVTEFAGVIGGRGVEPKVSKYSVPPEAGPTIPNEPSAESATFPYIGKLVDWNTHVSPPSVLTTKPLVTVIIYFIPSAEEDTPS